MSLTEHGRGSILSDPVDVGDWGETIITFSDNTKAVVSSGVRNSVEAYTPNHAMMCYHGDTTALDGVDLTGKVETKAGRQHVFLNEEEMRGYVGQFEAAARGKRFFLE